MQMKKVIIFANNSKRFHRFCHGLVQVESFICPFDLLVPLMCFISVLNPLIYSFFGQNFRRQTINIIQRYINGEPISQDTPHVPSKYVFILRHQLSDVFRLVRVKTFVQRTTTEYDDNGRELEHAGTKVGILI